MEIGLPQTVSELFEVLAMRFDVIEDRFDQQDAALEHLIALMQWQNDIFKRLEAVT